MMLLNVSFMKLLRSDPDKLQRREEVFHGVHDLLQERLTIQMGHVSLTMWLRVLKLLKSLEHLFDTAKGHISNKRLGLLRRQIDGPCWVVTFEATAEELHELLAELEHLIEFIS